MTSSFITFIAQGKRIGLAESLFLSLTGLTTCGWSCYLPNVSHSFPDRVLISEFTYIQWDLESTMLCILHTPTIRQTKETDVCEWRSHLTLWASVWCLEVWKCLCFCMSCRFRHQSREFVAQPLVCPLFYLHSQLITDCYALSCFDSASVFGPILLLPQFLHRLWWIHLFRRHVVHPLGAFLLPWSVHAHLHAHMQKWSTKHEQKHDARRECLLPFPC